MAHFISFEGIDGSGKTTQIKHLMTWFASQNIVAHDIREPGSTKVSDQIRTLLLRTSRQEFTPTTEVLLFYAARFNVLEKIVLPKLLQKEWIIADRYIDSTRVYQHEVHSLIIALEQVLKVPLPSLTFLMDVPDIQLSEERMQKRGKKNVFDHLKSSHLIEMRDTYREIAQSETERFVVIDASMDVADIQTKIRHTIKTRLIKE